MKYEIVYSNRKTITLCVKDGALTVKAPFGTSRRRIDELVSEHSSWVEKSIIKERKRNSKFDSLTEEDIAKLRKTAKSIIPPKVEHYSKIMGLKYGRITITGAKTRFGSCASSGNLSFSYRLMLYPEEAIDYVVVHELAHLKEMNHSPRFYKIVESVLPNYRERKKLLKK